MASSVPSANVSDQAFWTPKTFFLAAVFAYLVLNVAAVAFLISSENPTIDQNFDGAIAGVCFGSIYVFISLYYVYDAFLSPYIAEKQRPMSGILPQIFRWVVPALALQVIVVVGFLYIVDKTGYRESVLTHPVLYGQLFVKWNTFSGSGPGSYDPLAQPTHRPIKKIGSEVGDFHQTRAMVLCRSFGHYIYPHVKLEDNSGLDCKQYLARKTNDPGLHPDVLNDLTHKLYQIPFFIALAFGFVGSLVYSLKDVAYRLYTLDLYPNTLVSYIIRFIFSAALCLVIAYFMMDNWLIQGAPLLFFFIGFFPDRALQYIESHAMKLLSLTKDKRNPSLPLSLIQGMTEYFIYRFEEIGIRDAQNLAFVDLGHLVENLGYSRRLLLDFVSQAMLLVLIPEHFVTVQKTGARDIIAFRAMAKESIDTHNDSAAFAKLIGLPGDQVNGLLSISKTDAWQRRIDTIANEINKCNNEEQSRFAAA